MDIRLLKTFLAVVKYESISIASEAVHLTQPAVTKQVQLLEERYRVKLFERGKTLRLTEQGQVLFAYAAQIVDVFENSYSAVQTSRNQIKGTIRFGANMTIGNYVMPPIVRAFSALYPEITFDIAIHNTETILRLLKQKMCNVVFAASDLADPSMISHFFFDDRLVIVLGKALSGGEKKMSWKQLQKIPFISRERGSDIRESSEKWLKQRGIKLEPFIELTNVEGAKRYVENGLGFSLLPRFTVEKELQQGSLFVIAAPYFKLVQEYYIYHFNDVRLTRLEQIFLDFLFNAIESGAVRTLLEHHTFEAPQAQK